MRPALAAGDFVVIRRPRRAPRHGERVVFDHPTYGTLIKRVDAVEPDGSLRCRSDNPNGLDSQAIGAIDPQALRGVVWFAIRQPASH